VRVDVVSWLARDDDAEGPLAEVRSPAGLDAPHAARVAARLGELLDGAEDPHAVLAKVARDVADTRAAERSRVRSDGQDQS
jgi:hypothetical protein